jgi:hypothetical protein
MVGMRAGQARAEAQQAQQQQAQQAQQQSYEQGKQEAAAAQAAPTPAPAAPAAPAASAGGDLTAQLQSLANLHSSGVLTDEEYAAAKKKLLNI